MIFWVLLLPFKSVAQGFHPKLKCYTGIISSDEYNLDRIPTTAGIRFRADITKSLGLITGINFAYEPLLGDQKQDGQRVVRLSLRYEFAQTRNELWKFNVESGLAYAFNEGIFIPAYLGADRRLTDIIHFTSRIRFPIMIDYWMNWYDQIEYGFEWGLTIFLQKSRKTNFERSGNPFILQ